MLKYEKASAVPFVFMWVENIPTQSHNAYDAGGDGPARKSFVGDNFVQQKSKKANFLLYISSANEKYLLVYHLLEGHWIYSEESCRGSIRQSFSSALNSAANFKLWKKYLLGVPPLSLLLEDWLGGELYQWIEIVRGVMRFINPAR